MNTAFRSYRRKMFALLTVIYVMEMYFRNCLNVGQDVLEANFGLGAAAWGLLGSTYFYAQTAMTLPSGIVVDSSDIKTVYRYSLGAVVIGGLLFSAAINMTMLVLGRFLVGAGEVFLFTAWFKSLSYWYPKQSQDRLTGVVTCLAYGIGIMALSPMSRALKLLPWRIVYAIPAVISLVVLLSLQKHMESTPEDAGFRAIPEIAVPNEKQGTSWQEVLHGMAVLLRQRRTWPPLVMMAGVMGASATLSGVWGISFLAEACQITSARASELLTGTLVGTAAAAMAGPEISRRMGSRRIPLVACCLGQTVCWIVLLWATDWLSATGLAVLLLLSGFCNAPTVLGMLLVKEMNPAKYIGVSVALFSLGTVAGGALFPTLVGVIYQRLGNGLIQYRTALSICILMLLVSTVCACVTETHCQSCETAAYGGEKNFDPTEP